MALHNTYMAERREQAAGTSEKGSSSRRLSAVFTLVALLLVFGTAARLGQFIANRALWLDESILALSIAVRSFRGLLQPLDHDQQAPIGFLVLEKLAVRAFGTGEYALRLVPLIAGICAVPLFYSLAKLCMQDRRARLLALSLFCASQPLIYYASEVKQYSIDVFIAVAILWLTLHSLQHGLDARRYIGFALLGAIAVWFSFPAVFVLAGSAMTLAARELSLGRRGSVYKMLSMAAIWGVSFAIDYALFAKTTASNKVMLNFWRFDFAPLPVSVAGVMWYIQVAFSCMRDVFGSSSALRDLGTVLSGLAIVSALAGMGTLFASGRWTLAALLAPVAFTLLASSLKMYPFAGRLLLFLHPIFILLVAAGTQEGSGRTHTSVRLIRWATVLLALAPLVSATTELIKPPGKQETRSVLSYIGERARAGDLVYMYPAFQPSIDYYRRFGKISGLSDLTYLEGDPEQWPTYDADLGRLRGHSRVWVFLCHTRGEHGPDDQSVLLSAFDRKGKRLDEFHATGAAVYLYDLSILARR